MTEHPKSMSTQLIYQPDVEVENDLNVSPQIGDALPRSRQPHGHTHHHFERGREVGRQGRGRLLEPALQRGHEPSLQDGGQAGNQFNTLKNLHENLREKVLINPYE